jgi:CelD/BcsL family acetyltransferase involved in cellulose biosynthesis
MVEAIQNDRVLKRRLTTEEVGTSEGLRALEGVWDDLLSRSGTQTVFLTFDWLSTWWRHFGQSAKLRVIVVKDGERAIGIAPLMQVRYWFFCVPVHKILFLGTWGSDRLDFILPERKEDVLAAIWSHLKQSSRRWNVWEVEKILEDSPNLAALRRVLSSSGGHLHGYRPCFDSPYLPLEGGWEKYISGKKRLRLGLNSSRNRLLRMGTLRVEDRSGPQEIDRALQTVSTLEARGSRRKDSLFGDPVRRSFYEQIARRFSEKGKLSLSFLLLEGNPIAYDLSFAYHGTVVGYALGYDQKYRRESPAKVLLAELVRSCFERGLKEFDFSAGDEPYKMYWTNRVRHQVSFLVFNQGLRGRLLYLFHICFLPGLERLGFAALRRRLEQFRIFRALNECLAGIKIGKNPSAGEQKQDRGSLEEKDDQGQST